MRIFTLVLLAGCGASAPAPIAKADCEPADEFTVFEDLDGDGFGNDASPLTVCALPAEGASEVGGDCDDADPLKAPVDNDGDGFTSCDGDCDDGDSNLSPFDNDGDGWSSCDGDCDDDDPTLNLDDLDGDLATTCDGDCNDENPSRNLDDLDGDGFSTCDNDCDDGDPLLDPADLDGDGQSTCQEDCDDSDPIRFAGADDPCLDGIDQDCDGADDPCRELFVIGSDQDYWETYPNYFRGLVFLPSAAVELVDYGWYLDLPTQCDIDYYVHEGPTMDGPWTVVYTATVTHGPANGFHWSPTVSLPLVLGNYYGIGVAWNCEATYYIDYTYWGGVYPLGEYLQSYWDNSYPGFSPNYVPPNSSGTSVSAHYATFGYF